MRVFRLSNLFLIGLMMLSNLPGEEQVSGFPLHLFVVLPALLIKIGLAAPVVLAVLAKLFLALVAKKKIAGALLLPALLKGGSHDSHSSSGYGSNEDLGRIKRSVDLVQGIVGKVEISEEQLLRTILNLDSNRCGEKLLCEVAAQSRRAGGRGITRDESAMISLFTERDALTGKHLGPAQQVYRSAMMTGFKTRDCASQFPSCPYGKEEMMGLVNLVVEADSSNNVRVPLFPDPNANANPSKTRNNYLNQRPPHGRFN